MLTGDDLTDFGLLTRLVSALMYARTSGNWHLADAGLVQVILVHSRMLFLMGGQRGIDRAFRHIGQQVGPTAAAAALEIWRSDQLVGINEEI